MADTTVSKANDLPVLGRLWLKPIEGLIPVLKETEGKRLGDLTMPEVMAWGLTVSYCLATGMLAGNVAANLARVALHGPRG